MYSQKLQEFVDAHRPDEVRWSPEEVKALAEKASLDFRTPGQPDESGIRLERYQVILWGELSDRRARVKVGWGPFTRVAEAGPFLRHYRALSFEQGKEVEVRWSVTVISQILTFNPWISGLGWDSFGATPKDPQRALLEAADLDPITIDLPETTVELPRAPWDHSYPVDWGSGWIDDTEVIFASEVADSVGPFLKELVGLTSGAFAILTRGEIEEILASAGWDEEEMGISPELAGRLRKLINA